MPTKRATAPPAEDAPQAAAVAVPAGTGGPRVAAVMSSTFPPATAPRETWFDLLPAESSDPDLDTLLTREDVLNDLRARGVEVNEGTLVYWEKAGVVPRPVRRWRAGAPRVLYPPWAVPAIARVRDFQEAGNPLPIIGELVRAWVRQTETPPRDPRLVRAVGRAIEALADEERRRTGVVTTGAQLRLTDETGRVHFVHDLALRWPADPDGEPDQVTPGSTSGYSDTLPPRTDAGDPEGDR